MQIPRDAVETIESLHHLAVTWRQAPTDPGRFIDEVIAPTLADVVAALEAARGREAVAASLAGIDAREAEAVARRARILNTERGTT